MNEKQRHIEELTNYIDTTLRRAIDYMESIQTHMEVRKKIEAMTDEEYEKALERNEI